MTLSCQFAIEKTTADELVIRDVGKNVRSVTNDAEAVVDQLLKAAILRPGVRLLYYDSNNDLDEIKFDANGFVGFKILPRFDNPRQHNR